MNNSLFIEISGLLCWAPVWIPSFPSSHVVYRVSHSFWSHRMSGLVGKYLFQLIFNTCRCPSNQEGASCKSVILRTGVMVHWWTFLANFSSGLQKHEIFSMKNAVCLANSISTWNYKKALWRRRKKK